MRIIKAIFIKQGLSYLKKPAIISMPAMFLGMSLLFRFLLPQGEGSGLVNSFVVMFIGLAMVGTASSFIMEDRFTMNLRFMAMAGVKPYQYLISTSGALMIASLVVLTLFAMVGDNFGADMVDFLSMAMLGATTSIVLGITLSLSKVFWLGQPIGMILGFAPMLSNANETVASIFYYTYTQTINRAFNSEEMSYYDYIPRGESIQIILWNLGIILVIFVWMHTRHGLGGEVSEVRQVD